MSARATMSAAWTALFIFAPCAIAAPSDCPHCPEWTAPQKPFKVYGDTYYVGTQALASILITSSSGHILIDGTVQEAAPQIAANVRSLGFRVDDIRVILNSHVHFDHAGAIAALQRMSGAQVAASPASARVLMQGRSEPDDPQFASLLRGPDPVAHVRILEDHEAVSVGPLRLTPYFTPGHTPGGTTWTWRSCEQGRCLNIVYADSLGAVSAKKYQFSQSPAVLRQFAQSFVTIRNLPCDILLTAHPDFADVFGRLRRRDGGNESDAFIDPTACRRYADEARANLEKRIADERSGGPR